MNAVCHSILEEEVRREQQEINRWIQRYLQGLRLPSLKDQTVILVDDGIATGATFYASLQLCAISTSAGLSPLSSPHDLGRKVDEVVILAMPSLFFGIDQFYLDWLKWRTKK